MICDDVSIIFEALLYEIKKNGLGTTLRQKSKVWNWKESKIQMIVNTRFSQLFQFGRNFRPCKLLRLAQVKLYIGCRVIFLLQFLK